MRTFVLCVMLFAVFLLVPTGVTYAQDAAQPVFCGDLDEEDCQLLTSSRAAMEELTAGASQFRVEGLFEDVAGAPSGTFTYGQDTRFNIDPATLDRIQAVRAMDEDALASMLSDPEAYTDFIVGIVNGLDLEQTILINLSDELTGDIAEQYGWNLPSELSVSYVLKDGTGYILADDLGKILPSLAFLEGWIGVNLPAALSLLISDGQLTPPDDAADFQSGLLIPGLAYTGTGLLSDEERSAMFDAHMTITREDDESIDGASVARFSTELDIVELLADPDVQLWLVDIFGEELMGLLGISKDNLGGMPAVLNLAGPALFNELHYRIDQYVGTEDALLRRNEVDLSWDLSRLSRAIGRQVDDRVYVEFVTSNDNSEFDAADIEAPGGALVLPVELIMTLLSSLDQ